MVYTSASLSLAALEYFVHLDTDLAPADLVAVAAVIPDGVAVERLEARDLPRTWRRYPAPEALRDVGTGWVARGATAVLGVPSAVIPPEYNYLVNPAHVDFKRIRIREPEPFRFDPRLWK